MTSREAVGMSGNFHKAASLLEPKLQDPTSHGFRNPCCRGPWNQNALGAPILGSPETEKSTTWLVGLLGAPQEGAHASE